MTTEELEKVTERFTLAGRLMAVRDFGKGAFISIQDRKGRLQAFLRKNQLGEKAFSLFKRLDIGDIVWIAGRVFKTKTGELTIDVEENGLRLLSKSTPSSAGEMARPDGRRDPLPAASPRSDRESGGPRRFSRSGAGSSASSAASWKSGTSWKWKPR